MRVIAVGIHEIIDDDRAIKRFANSIPFRVVGVFHDNGRAVAGGVRPNQMIFRIILVADGLFGARFFDEVAVGVIAGNIKKEKGG